MVGRSLAGLFSTLFIWFGSVDHRGTCMSNFPVRVLIVDDHEPFRRSVASLLGELPKLQIIGQASDGLEAVRKVAELEPDLVLLDIGLPKLNGIEAARRIREHSPE